MPQLFSFIRLIFFAYTLMLLARVIGTWFPKFSGSRFMLFISHYTDPYLNFFRRFIPLIGGVIDLSPLVGFIALQLLEKLILTLLIYAIR